MRRRHCNKLFAIAAACVTAPLTAYAQQQSGQASDPQARPHMLAESAEATDVVDALDIGSVWSFRFTAGYGRRLRTSTLQRERSVISNPNPTVPPPPTGTTEFDNIARYTQVTQTLNLRAELAVFHDVALTFTLPLILSDTREFTAHSDLTASQQIERLNDGGIDPRTGMASQLFNVGNGGFRSPERSGIDQVHIGFMWNILNQARDPHHPTWLVRAEWRPPVGAPLRPCYQDSGGQTHCPLYQNEPGGTARTDGYQRPEQSPAAPGISRRLHGLYLQTLLSRRIGYVETYIGMDFMVELPENNLASFRFGNQPYGQLATYPPIQGSLIAGAEIVPWENRETWQKFMIDLRLRAAYFSQGRDYTPLYDALGSSNSLPLTSANYDIRSQAMNDMSNPVYFLGTTSVHSHGEIGARVAIGIQPAKFLRFSFGGSVTYVTPFLMTATDACNPNENPGMDHPEYRGGCVGDAAPDPQHHPVIDSPGNRFRFVDDYIWDVFVNVALTPRL